MSARCVIGRKQIRSRLASTESETQVNGFFALDLPAALSPLTYFISPRIFCGWFLSGVKGAKFGNSIVHSNASSQNVTFSTKVPGN